MDDTEFLKIHKQMIEISEKYLEMHKHVCSFLLHKRELENVLEKLDRRVKELEKKEG